MKNSQIPSVSHSSAQDTNNKPTEGLSDLRFHEHTKDALGLIGVATMVVAPIATVACFLDQSYYSRSGYNLVVGTAAYLTAGLTTGASLGAGLGGSLYLFDPMTKKIIDMFKKSKNVILSRPFKRVATETIMIPVVAASMLASTYYGYGLGVKLANAIISPGEVKKEDTINRPAKKKMNAVITYEKN